MSDAMGGIAVIVLAAGGSSRMGTPKQLLPYRAKSLLVHAAEAALGAACGPVVVVIGSEAQRMRQELQLLPVCVVENEAWEEGLGRSIGRGVEEAQRRFGPLRAALMMLCDQPAVRAELLESLVRTYGQDRRGIVACEYDGRLGVPALFDRRFFDELKGLAGAQGAKRVIEAHRQEAAAVPFADGAIDVDTLEDYARLRTQGGWT